MITYVIGVVPVLDKHKQKIINEIKRQTDEIKRHEYRHWMIKMEQNNFDIDAANKLWTPRALNVVHVPIAGQVWLFFDAEREKSLIRWEIKDTHLLEGDVEMVEIEKISGIDLGFKIKYPTAHLAVRRWKPETVTEDNTTYLWACPSCEEDKPVLEGDYVCTSCRSIA